MTDPLQAFGLSGRVALVTGASRGIGKVIAEALDGAGARVYRHVRQLGSSDQAADNRQGGRLVAGDLSGVQGIDAVISQLVHEDRVDILVNNAGVEHAELSTDLSAALWDETMTVNAFAPARLVGGLLPQLRASASASVINISSVHESFPYPGHLAYSASKAALGAVTRSLAVELGPAGIRVNSIVPGIIETDINREVFDTQGRQVFEDLVPMARVGTPEDLVGAVIFLASDASRYVTGATLHVDGGYSVNLARYFSNESAGGDA